VNHPAVGVGQGANVPVQATGACQDHAGRQGVAEGQEWTQRGNQPLPPLPPAAHFSGRFGLGDLLLLSAAEVIDAPGDKVLDQVVTHDHCRHLGPIGEHGPGQHQACAVVVHAQAEQQGRFLAAVGAENASDQPAGREGHNAKTR